MTTQPGDYSQKPEQNAATIEQWLIAQIAELLGVDPESVDPHESFDSFGLSSREAVTLSGDLEELLKRQLSPTVVYEYPTISGLAAYLAADGAPQPVSVATQDLGVAMQDIPSPGQPAQEPIAIIGIGCRFPGAEGLTAFWDLLQGGVDAIAEAPSERWQLAELYDPAPGTSGKLSTRWGGFLERVDQFDARFFGIAPREAERMDPQQRILLETTWEAFEHAGLPAEQLAGSSTGVFVGISSNDYALLQGGDLSKIDAYAGTGNAASIAANRLSYTFDLRGPSLAIDTACSSSLVALHLAARSLRSGESSLALAAGVNLTLAPELTITFSHARMMAADGRCKTFDASADGYVRGEGCGVVVLKRLSDAQRDGNRVLALLRGSAVNQDGHSNGLTAPNGLAQQAVVRAALADAGLSANDIGYIEAHGTGTILGDPIEVRALAAVLAERSNPTPVALGSVKTNIGHLEAAAGVAGLIKVVLALRHETIPPHLHLQTLNPHIELGTALSIPTTPQPWPAAGQRRVAGISSFGFGGTNAHVIIEGAPASQAPTTPARPRHILTLSAKDETALRALAGRYATQLATPAAALADICYTANVGRSQFSQRLALDGTSHAELREQLATFAATGSAPRVQHGQVRNTRAPKIAFLFTGQGAQYLGMGQQLYASEPTFRAVVDQCAELLLPELGLDLRTVLFGTDEDGGRRTEDGYLVREAQNQPSTVYRLPSSVSELPSSVNGQELDQTQYTQPALFVIEYALAQLWMSWGVQPAALLGHSVGEYVAACIAGVFSLEDGLRLIAARARLMGALPAGGAMATVFASRAVLDAALADQPDVAIAAVNGPASLVISGAAAAVAAVRAALQAQGVESRPLTVSHAFHSPLMEPMLDEFAAIAAGMSYHAPTIPLISNLSGQPLTQAPDAAYWRQHLREAVQFYAGVQALAAAGCELFVEVGPHPALISLAKRCLPGETYGWLPSLRRNQDNWAVLLESLGGLYLKGVAIDWASFEGQAPRTHVDVPSYPFQRERYWFSPTTGYRVQRALSPAVPTAQPASGAGHALLGRRVASPLSVVQFEHTLNGMALAALNGQAEGEGLFRALALAAAQAVFGAGTHSIAALAVHQPLTLDAHEQRNIQTIFDPTGPGGAAFQVFSQVGDSWLRHSSGIVLQGAPAVVEVVEVVAATPPAELSHAALLAASATERQGLLLEHLRARLARVLRLAPAQIDSELPLSSLGLDSIMAIELKTLIERELTLQVPIATLVAGPSLAQLAAELVAQLDTPTESTGLQHEGPEAGEFALSFGQRALWLQHQISPDSVFNPTYAARARMPVDASALRAAFQAIVERHPALRTTFGTRGGVPFQVVHPWMEVAFEHIDASGWSEAHLHTRLAAQSRIPFDLEQGPLLRVHLFSLAEAEHVIMLSAHHIVSDLWSNAMIVAEVGQLYATAGAYEPLSANRLRYSDYLRWEAGQLAGPEGERLWAYWRTKLAGELPLLNLPTDRPRPPVQTFNGASVPLLLSPALTERLKQVSEAAGATLYMTLLAAFQLLLHRYSGQEEVIVGTPTTGRSQAALTDIVGYFVNPVALRTSFAGNPGFSALLRQVRQTVLEAIEHQDYPVALLVEKLQPERNASRTPLFQTMFVYQRAHLLAEAGLSSFAINGAAGQMQLGSLALEAVAIPEQIAPFDLTMMLAEAATGLAGSLTYNTDLFDQATAERLLTHYTTLLEAIVATPEREVAHLPLLPASERQQVLVAFNNTGRDLPIDQPVTALFEAQVDRTPDAVAVLFDDQQLSYAELDARANQLAHTLRGHGVEPEVLVGIYAERSIEMVVAVLGVLKAGGAYMPIDPTYPADRVAFMLEDARPAVVLTMTDDGRPKTENDLEIDTPVHRLPASVQINLHNWQQMSQAPTTRPTPSASADNLAYVIYTSGSTGKPKGVLLQHRGLCNLALAQIAAFGVTPQSRVLQFASFSFDASVSEICMALLSGAALVLARRETLLSGSELVRLMRTQQVTVVTLPPSLLALLPPEQVPALQTVISAGEACPAEIARRWSNGRRFFNAYGPTEATIGPTLYEVTTVAPGTVNIPIGKPIANTQVYLLDAQRQPVPIGVPGELYLAGVGLARGYLNRPELTAERFVEVGVRDQGSGIRDRVQRHTAPDPWPLTPDPSRLYRTGDLARYLPDGTIEYLGRADQQVKIRGFRIELGEIETALARHPSVQDAVVMVREDLPGDKRLVAYVVQHAEFRVQNEELRVQNEELRVQNSATESSILNSSLSTLHSQLRTFLKAQLPDYMVPTAFVVLDVLPLTPNGKVDRRALPVPQVARAAGAAYARPRNELEQTLAAIWSPVLGVEQVGIHDNFFDLGGHSLLMARVHDQLQTTLGRTISIVDLFRYPTISTLAEHLSRDPNDRQALQTSQDRAQKQREALQRQQMQAAAARRNALERRRG